MQQSPEVLKEINSGKIIEDTNQMSSLLLQLAFDLHWLFKWMNIT